MVSNRCIGCLGVHKYFSFINMSIKIIVLPFAAKVIFEAGLEERILFVANSCMFLVSVGFFQCCWFWYANLKKYYY